MSKVILVVLSCFVGLIILFIVTSRPALVSTVSAARTPVPTATAEEIAAAKKSEAETRQFLIAEEAKRTRAASDAADKHGKSKRGRTTATSYDLSEAKRYFQCANLQTRWTASELQDTFIILSDGMLRAGLDQHQAEAFTVMTGFAATGADKTLGEMRQGVSQVLAGSGPASRKERENLDEKYVRYCPGGVAR